MNDIYDEPNKSEFHMIIIAKSWPMKLMMNILLFVKTSPTITFSPPLNLRKDWNVS
jgi:hypothetical protein